MSGRDPTHWLHRLDPDEWLAAAEVELAHCREALERRAVRPGVTHARRAAGMAVNAVLVLREDPRFGRSYMEHVVALCTDEGSPAEVREGAARLRDTAPAPPELVKLGRPDLGVLEAARTIVESCRRQVAQLRLNG
jgi:HEPN domain-containing protein